MFNFTYNIKLTSKWFYTHIYIAKLANIDRLWQFLQRQMTIVVAGRRKIVPNKINLIITTKFKT